MHYYCYLLLTGQIGVVFPNSTWSSPAPYAMLIKNEKTQPMYHPFLPKKIGWYRWENAIVPVLNDVDLNPNDPINKLISDKQYINLIKIKLIESHKTLNMIPEDF